MIHKGCCALNKWWFLAINGAFRVAQGLSQMAVDEEAFPSLGGPATQRASKGKSGRF